MAIPGSIVATGKLITPGGAAGPQGPAGSPGSNCTTQIAVASFTVPAYGASVVVSVLDSSWMVPGEWLYIADAGGTGVAGQLQVQSVAPGSVTLVNPPSGTSGTPRATQFNDGLLAQVSGNTTDFIDGTNNSQPIAPQITAVRLRSFNAIGNPNFEVDQRNAGASVGLLGNWAQDRWASNKAGTMSGTLQQIAVPDAVVPGTNFRISRCAMRLTLTTQEAALAAGDYHILNQYIEGPFFRELSLDVHSISLLVRSSVAGLNFGVVLKDPPNATKTLVKLCTIPSANTWTLISLPNLPVCPSGNFTSVPGANGYQIGITLACGSTFMSPANDTWQTGSFWGAVGQSNFYGQPVNSTFDIAFIQHEPGPVCSTFIDKPFSQNLDECLRYYQKTYDYATAVGTVTAIGARNLLAYIAAAAAQGVSLFQKPMAKIPAATLYDHMNGAAGSVADQTGTHHTGATVTPVGLSSNSFYSIGFTTATTGIMPVYFHYTADTGW